jgi:SAM-dependent methyltransferase
VTTPPSIDSPCPLCGALAHAPFLFAEGRRYRDCPTCGLIWMHPGDRLPGEEERARYETHENYPYDPGYRAFLDRLCAPLVRRLPPGAEGLDLGSGPGPTLSVMLEEQGFPMRIFDPFFAPDLEALDHDYDFITCTETAEHFFDPGREFRRLDGLLRPGGWLGVMTEVVDEDRAFPEWYYVRDPTHVAFYRRSTLEWIAASFGWSVEFPHRNVALFRKPGGAKAPPALP